MIARSVFLSLAVSLPMTLEVAAEAVDQPDKKLETVTFNHLEGVETAYTLRLQHLEKFTVSITNTCPKKFAYEVRGIRGYHPPPTTLVNSDAKLPANEKRSFTVVHSDSFGGYVVDISDEKPSLQCVDEENGKTLEPKTFFIFTPILSDWHVSVSGGFTISGLVDPVYAVLSNPTTPGLNEVVERKDRRDSANLGIATFVNTYSEHYPRIGLSFGLGIRGANETEYYVGGGLRLSDKTTINFGRVFGPVAHLPAALSLGETVEGSNTLSTLPTRIGHSWYVGISYSFIDVGDRIQRPFAGSGGGS